MTRILYRARPQPYGAESAYDVRLGQYIAQDSSDVERAFSDIGSDVSDGTGAGVIGYSASVPYTEGLGFFLNNVHGRTAAEVSAGVTPTNYFRLERDPRRYGAVMDGVTSDQTALAAALNVADEVVGASQGSHVPLPQGTARMTATLNIPNRVQIVGVNKRGSTLQAASGFSGTYMLTANNGLISMFDNALEKCNLDCNDIAGLGGVLSDAWQEGGGMRHVLINKFRSYGVRFQNGYGGAASCLITDCEIFGSAAGATAGIRIDSLSLTGSFKLTVQNTTIAGGGTLTSSLPRAIDVVNDSTLLLNVHFEVCQSGLYIDGVGDHVLINVDGAGGSSIVDALVTIASTFTGTLTMIGCKRNGATNFLVDNRVGGLGTITGYDIPHLTIGAVNQAVRSDNTASAWVVFDGTGANGTKVPNASYNVSNVNKTATGTYRVTLQRAMKSTFACVIGDCNLAAAATHVRTVLVSSTAFDLFVYTNGVLTDSNEVKGLIFGG